jgi:aminoglycoside phosphotransferase family enzyme/predicted kinase
MTVLDALRDPALYGVQGPVEVRETHISRVFLAGDRAFKLKKPLRLSFVDYGTRERRRAMCEEEIRLNRRLAPGIYLGVRSVVPRGAGFALDRADAADAVEHLVEMRRFDEAHTLAARLAAGRVRYADIDAVARAIADFHRTAERVPLSDGPERLWAALDDSLEALSGRDGIAPLRRFATAYMCRHGRQLRERGRLAVDGHADLRAEHVVLEESVQIVDCVEFDADLRIRDPASDLAFLAMDIEALGDPRRARRLVESYRAAGGDAGPDHLVAFYSAERALVRAKVDTVRAGQLGGDPTLLARGGARIALARRLSWRARGPVAIVVCGLSGSGKSWLASALTDVLGARVISSDRVRKELAGVAPAARAPTAAYTPEFNARVYTELGRRAGSALDREPAPVVVDATARKADDRRRLVSALGREPLFARCVAPAETLRERVAARAQAGGSVSDADLDVLARQSFEPFADVRRENVGELRTDRPVDQVVDELEAWLDERLAS